MTRTERFFERIRLPADVKIEYTPEFLGRVQSACVCAIAYENLDILAGHEIRLVGEALFEKIVVNGRGGYCFELNGLLSHMLREMGFCVSERFARFLRGEKDVPMRRHRISVVSLSDGDYLLDIGVGQIAPRLPLKIENGLVQTQNGETYRFSESIAHGRVLNELHGGEWREYLGFSDDQAYEVDFLQPSFFCEKHPDSVFNKRRMIAIKTEKGRKTIDGSTYKEFEGEALVQIRENLTDPQIEELLREEFLLSSLK